MEILLIIISVVVVIGLAATIFLINQSMRKLREFEEKQKQNPSVLMFQEQLKEIRNTLDLKLSESTKMFAAQRHQDVQIIKELTERVTKLDETNRQVVNFADQLQNLQDILQNPKQRGILGEYQLEATLRNVLPPGVYKTQYKIGKDEMGKDLIVDAAIFIKEKIIPIDSKFSLENYNKIIEERDQKERGRLEQLFKQDLKNRIIETAKYVQPTLNTMNFAFMFIPSEAVYYDLLINKVGAVKTDTRSLIEYAFRDKKVIIVSPTTFLAYLQMVLQGLKNLEIEKTTQEIIKRLEILAKHMANYDSFLQRLGNNLGTTVNAYNQAYKEFQKIDKDVLKISGQGGEIKPFELEKPKQE